MKAVLVGEVNPYGRNPDHALYPLPRGASGDRLRQVMGLTDAQYLRDYRRENLCVGLWVKRLAEDRAKSLATEWSVPLVLLGAKVCAAFGLEFRPFTVFERGKFVAVILPHTSGRSRLWNGAGAYAAAREALATAGVI